MLTEAHSVWERMIRQHGHRADGSRYAGYSVKIVNRSFGVGAEYQPYRSSYRWNGYSRGGSEKSRWMAFQWTLDGEGILRVGDKEYSQKPGQAFCVPIPSDHEYRISETTGYWKFFYIFLNIHWVTERIAKSTKEFHYTFPLDDRSRLGMDSLRLIEQMFAHHLEDPYEAEKTLLPWMVELERHLYQLRHPEDSRKEMLSLADKFFQANKSRSFGVQDFASYIGMSRAQASLQFKKITGMSPAAYFNEIRLKEATILLGQGHKLQYIADETGFADANHLCKVFRRVYHVSPGQFRNMHGVTFKAE